MINLQKKEEMGITLVALVITIVVLIILAGIAISMTIGNNGIFTRAKEAKRLQIIAEAKEKIGADILDAQIEATQKDEELQQSKLEEIIAKYGELQEDGDTIKLKDNGYEISLKEIYNGKISSSGGSTENTELDSLKAELAKTNATADKILKDYKVYSNGELLTGTMENYAGQTIETSSVNSDETNTYATIPKSGYYDSNSKISLPKIKTEEKDIIEKLKTYASLSLKIKDETNYNGINGYRAILDNSSQKIKSVTITFKRSTTYGYFKLDYSEKYISGYTDQADSNFVAIASYTDMDEHSIKIDMLGHNYLNIADAHAGTIPTVSIADIEFVE